MKKLIVVAALVAAALSSGCKQETTPRPLSPAEIISRKYERLHKDWQTRFDKAQDKMCHEQVLLEDLHTPKAKFRLWGAKNNQILWAFQREKDALNAAQRAEEGKLQDTIIAAR